MKIAIRLEAAALVMMRLGIEVDIEKTHKFIENLTPNLQTGEIKGSLIFFQKLESESSDAYSEDGSTPSREEIKALQGSTLRNTLMPWKVQLHLHQKRMMINQ